jgi:DNA polymerase-3 subunit alpha
MQEASRAGIKVLPPDINRSAAEFTIEPAADGPDGAQPAPSGTHGKIRFALAAIKRVGLQAMKDLVAARQKPFDSVADFAERVDPRLLNKMQLENLAKAGAFDSLGASRAGLVAGAETLLRRAQAMAEERASAQVSLFGTVEQGPPMLRLPEVQEWPVLDRLAFEAEAVGFHLTAHPLDEYKKALRALGVIPSAIIGEQARAGVRRVKLAGTVTSKKERNTKTGSRMAWVSMSDQSGSFEVTCFSEVLNRSRDMLEDGLAIIVTAEAKIENDALRLTALDVEPLDRAAAGVQRGIRLEIDRAEAIGHIRVLLAREGSGRGKVSLVPRLGNGQDIALALPGGFNVSPRMMQAMKVLPGVLHVEEV